MKPSYKKLDFWWGGIFDRSENSLCGHLFKFHLLLTSDVDVFEISIVNFG